jgi:hypothetical protein
MTKHILRSLPLVGFCFCADIGSADLLNQGVKIGDLRVDVSLSPMMQWSTNVNGGTHAKSFRLAGYTFVANPDTVAKSDLIAGVAAKATVSLKISPENELTYVHSKQDLKAVSVGPYEIQKETRALCLNSRLSQRNIRTCKSSTKSGYHLGDAEQSDFNVTASRVHARHVTQVTAGVLEKNNAQQSYLGFTYTKSLSRKPNHYTQFAMRVGERVDGVSFDVYKHTLTLNAPIKTSVSNGIKLYTSQTKTEGATLLGVDRDTNVLKVGALIDKKFARFDVSYGVELENSASSIEGFSYQRVNYLFNLKF